MSSGALIASLRNCAAGDAEGTGGGSEGSGSGEPDGSGVTGADGPEGTDGSADGPGCCGPPPPGGDGTGRCPPRVGNGSPDPTPACAPPGPTEARADALGLGDSAVSRSECASAPPRVRARPVPATVEPSGSPDEPLCSADRDGAGFPPSSLMLMQPVDAAIVTAVTAAHRTGAGNWRTGGTSGRRGAKKGGNGRGHSAQLPFPRMGHAPRTTDPFAAGPFAAALPGVLSRNRARAAARRRCRSGGRSHGRP